MSGCCVVSPAESTPKEGCPGCGNKGRPVSLRTVRAILKPDIAMGSGDPRFCPNPKCDHLYFDGTTVALKNAARVRIGIKESSDPVPLCYCFNWTRGDVRDELQTTGKCTLVERITVELQADHCACEVKNPSGKCCLGEVRKAIKEAQDFLQRQSEIGGRP